MDDIFNKKYLDRTDVRYVLSNLDNLREEQPSIADSKTRRRWGTLLAEKRISILRGWVKGLWIEDGDGDLCTAWMDEIALGYFTQMKVRLVSEVRVERKPNSVETRKANDIKRYCKEYSVPYTEDMERDERRLRNNQFEWISTEKFLDSNKSKWLSVLGASVLGEI
ncbi:hypothetical protein VPH166E361_0110 [Vibrio phage 166E36-1]